MLIKLNKIDVCKIKDLQTMQSITEDEFATNEL